MTEIIFRHNGTLDKFIGDGIMAVFGVPFEYENHAERAIRTALEMMKRIGEMNAGFSGKEEDQGPDRHQLGQADFRGFRFAQAHRIHRAGKYGQCRVAPRIDRRPIRRDRRLRDRLRTDSSPTSISSALGEKNLHGMSTSVKAYKVIGLREETMKKNDLG